MSDISGVSGSKHSSFLPKASLSTSDVTKKCFYVAGAILGAVFIDKRAANFFKQTFKKTITKMPGMRTFENKISTAWDFTGEGGFSKLSKSFKNVLFKNIPRFTSLNAQFALNYCKNSKMWNQLSKQTQQLIGKIPPRFLAIAQAATEMNIRPVILLGMVDTTYSSVLDMAFSTKASKKDFQEAWISKFQELKNSCSEKINSIQEHKNQLHAELDKTKEHILKTTSGPEQENLLQLTENVSHAIVDRYNSEEEVLKGTLEIIDFQLNNQDIDTNAKHVQTFLQASKEGGVNISNESIGKITEDACKGKFAVLIALVSQAGLSSSVQSDMPLERVEKIRKNVDALTSRLKTHSQKAEKSEKAFFASASENSENAPRSPDIKKTQTDDFKISGGMSAFEVAGKKFANSAIGSKFLGAQTAGPLGSSLFKEGKTLDTSSMMEAVEYCLDPVKSQLDTVSQNLEHDRKDISRMIKTLNDKAGIGAGSEDMGPDIDSI